MGMPQKFIPIHFRHGTADRHAGIFSAPVRTGHPAAVPLGDGHQPPVLGIPCPSGDSAAPLLVLARPQGPDRKSGHTAHQYPVPLWAGHAGWRRRCIRPGVWRRRRPPLRSLSAPVSTLQAAHTGVRMWCTSRIYGWSYAAGSSGPGCGRQLDQLLRHLPRHLDLHHREVCGRPLRWVKTEHAYPNRAALMTDRKRLGEILTSNRWITPEQLESALASRPEGLRLAST